MLRLVFRKTVLLPGLHPAEEVPVGGVEVQLGVAEGEAVHLLEPGELPLVSGRGDLQHLARLLVMGDLVGEHPVVDETGAAARALDESRLLTCRVGAVHHCLVHRDRHFCPWLSM